MTLDQLFRMLIPVNVVLLGGITLFQQIEISKLLRAPAVAIKQASLDVTPLGVFDEGTQLSSTDARGALGWEAQKSGIKDSAPTAADFLDGPHMSESYLADYAYSEVEPDKKPASVVLASLNGIPEGTPIEEIKRASDAFGIDAHYMDAVAKIESDFDPKQRTGSYVGLFQLSDYEFNKYGEGKITDARDNAIAAAYKFAVAGKLFEIATHRKPTPEDLYLIHQQGWQGAAEHVAHPERVAWQSMCATDEGRQKGEAWCKRAIWENTLPSVKKNVGSVDKLLSGDFVEMWAARVHHFLAAFSGDNVDNAHRESEHSKHAQHKVPESDRKVRVVKHHHHREA